MIILTLKYCSKKSGGNNVKSRNGSSKHGFVKSFTYPKVSEFDPYEGYTLIKQKNAIFKISPKNNKYVWCGKSNIKPDKDPQILIKQLISKSKWTEEKGLEPISWLDINRSILIITDKSDIDYLKNQSFPHIDDIQLTMINGRI